MTERKQRVLPMVALREAVDALVYVWLLQDGWLVDGSPENNADRRGHERKVLVEYALREGIVHEDDVIPF